MNTNQFLEYLNKELIKGDQSLSDKINAKAWIDESDLPADYPQITSSRFAFVDSVLKSFNTGQSISNFDTKNWSSHEWLYFIRLLSDDLTSAQIEDLKQHVDFANSGNSELEAAWFIHVIKHEYKKDYPAIEKFLVKVGRRKFLMPIYSELIKTPEGKKIALEIYKKARPNYHYVSTQSLDALLK